MGDFYVYQWIRPDTGAVFYVGKGSGRRDVQHKKNNKFFMRVVNKLSMDGLTPFVERVSEGLTEAEAFSIERSEIAKHGRLVNGTGTLANITDGGEGSSGYTHSEESRAKMAATKIGKPRSDETKAKLSAALIGRKLPAQQKAKMSEVRIGKPRTAETCERMVAGYAASPPRNYNSSGFKGITLQDGRWRVRFTTGGVRTDHGMFSTAEEAARVYDSKMFEIWGRNCYLNFPDEVA
ncbi:hypothetical protein IB276_26335 [Ensifer sp. ENS04]|uniref:NUMOD3 domain-containing DNA-binding protein n=1 Tax=Ensifer sp. ENS04 TaxID=2769281 RepID=UPI001784489C|nr:NUMOD3 domain-containing DNA-binding protein [Ensifer sp. ENS04]MBD9542968.1 hypothetical protein [Ensifer sp. ENS04]